MRNDIKKGAKKANKPADVTNTHVEKSHILGKHKIIKRVFYVKRSWLVLLCSFASAHSAIILYFYDGEYCFSVDLSRVLYTRF